VGRADLARGLIAGDASTLETAVIVIVPETVFAEQSRPELTHPYSSSSRVRIGGFSFPGVIPCHKNVSRRASCISCLTESGTRAITKCRSPV